MPAEGSYIGLIDTVLAKAHAMLPPGARPGQEHRRILARCQQPVTVVDLASDVDLPVGVVRVLLSDLSHWGAIAVTQAPRGHVTDERILRDVLNALQAL
jgi:hypothetical protein